MKSAPKPKDKPAGVLQQEVKLANGDSYKLKERLSQRSVEKSTEEAEQETSQLPEGPNEDVNVEALNTAWKRFADEHAADGPRSRYATLTGDSPLIEGNLIRFKVVNIIQQKDLDEVRGELMEFLRVELKNVNLQLEVQLEVQEDVKKEFLSEREKYDRMAKENPLLETLRKRLDLDLDV